MNIEAFQGIVGGLMTQECSSDVMQSQGSSLAVYTADPGKHAGDDLN